MVHSTSLSLVEQLRHASDREAWSRFIEIYQPFIFGYLRQRSVSASDAADVAQNVLEVVIREIGSFQHNERRGAFRKWLRMVTANRLREHWRENRRQPSAPGGSDFAEIVEQLSDADSELSRIWDQEYNRHTVDRLLALVAPRFRGKTFLAFRKLLLEDQDPQLVANELGMSINAVHIAKSRVLREIRKLGEGLVDV